MKLNKLFFCMDLHTFPWPRTQREQTEPLSLKKVPALPPVSFAGAPAPSPRLPWFFRQQELLIHAKPHGSKDATSRRISSFFFFYCGRRRNREEMHILSHNFLVCCILFTGQGKIWIWHLHPCRQKTLRFQPMAFIFTAYNKEPYAWLCKLHTEHCTSTQTRTLTVQRRNEGSSLVYMFSH